MSGKDIALKINKKISVPNAGIGSILLEKIFSQLLYLHGRSRWLLRPWNKIKPIFDYCYLRYHGVETEPGYVTLQGLPLIHKFTGSRIILGNKVTLVSHSKYNLAGINHPVILATFTENATIFIDEGSGLSGSTICAAQSIRIGKRCGLGVNASVYDTDFHPTDPNLRHTQKSVLDACCLPIKIDDDVWIGANSLILKGSNLGKAAVVGAGALITGHVEPYTIVAGNPARKVGQITVLASDYR